MHRRLNLLVLLLPVLLILFLLLLIIGSSPVLGRLVFDDIYEDDEVISLPTEVRQRVEPDIVGV